jgi:hypothetical protein
MACSHDALAVIGKRAARVTEDAFETVGVSRRPSWHGDVVRPDGLRYGAKPAIVSLRLYRSYATSHKAF